MQRHWIEDGVSLTKKNIVVSPTYDNYDTDLLTTPTETLLQLGLLLLLLLLLHTPVLLLLSSVSTTASSCDVM